MTYFTYNGRSSAEFGLHIEKKDVWRNPRWYFYVRKEVAFVIPVLYPPNTTVFSSFGLGVLTDTISCEVTEERNGVFECLLKYPVSGQHYELITKECIIHKRSINNFHFP